MEVVLITGCSSGIGLATASLLASQGYKVYATVRDIRQAAELKKRVRSTSAEILQIDVNTDASVRKAVSRILKKEKRIDVLINNAGIWGGDEALRLDRRTWDEVIETDLTGLFFVSQTVAATMVQQRYGKIINMASTAGVMALPHGAVYGTVKAGLMHLTKILAVEWGPFGIRVTGIAPGLFRTDMTRDLFADRRWSRRRQAEIPLRRFGEPEDLVGLAIFLASRASDHITGQTILIDGGASLTT